MKPNPVLNCLEQHNLCLALYDKYLGYLNYTTDILSNEMYTILSATFPELSYRLFREKVEEDIHYVLLDPRKTNFNGRDGTPPVDILPILDQMNRLNVYYVKKFNQAKQSLEKETNKKIDHLSCDSIKSIWDHIETTTKTPSSYDIFATVKSRKQAAEVYVEIKSNSHLLDCHQLLLKDYFYDFYGDKDRLKMTPKDNRKVELDRDALERVQVMPRANTNVKLAPRIDRLVSHSMKRLERANSIFKKFHLIKHDLKKDSSPTQEDY